MRRPKEELLTLEEPETEEFARYQAALLADGYKKVTLATRDRLKGTLPDIAKNTDYVLWGGAVWIKPKTKKATRRM